MAGGYSTPPGDGFDRIVQEFRELWRRLGELERPTGTSLNSLVAQVQAALANINATVTAAIAANSYTKAQVDSKVASPGAISPTTVAATGAVSGSSGAFSSSLSSPGAYTTDVSTLPGARQTVWQHNSGVYGFAPSSIVTKTNLGPVPFTADDVRAVSPFIFQYKAQLAIRDDPENAFYDPGYGPSWEIGLMAEHLIAHNMACFVFFEEDGETPKGINYDLFGAIAPLVVLADQERRLVELEARA
jgi:hypothetical protein